MSDRRIRDGKFGRYYVSEHHERFYVEVPLNKPFQDPPGSGSTTSGYVVLEVLPTPGHDAKKIAREVAKLLNARRWFR